MELTHVNDFYYLQSVILEAGKHPEDVRWLKAKEKCEELFSQLVPMLADSMFSYLFLACMGEARHASSTSAEILFSPELNCIQMPSKFYWSRTKVYKLAVNYSPADNIPQLIKLFDQKWAGAMGGAKWLQIVKGMARYLDPKWTKAAFIDYVVDLHHNCGTAFSKVESECAIDFSCNYAGACSFENFLDFKKEVNLATEPPWYDMYVSRDVRRAIAPALGEDIMCHLKTIPESRDWSWTKVEWGSSVITVKKKLTPNRDVSGMGNTWTATELVENLTVLEYNLTIFKLFVEADQLKAIEDALIKEMNRHIAAQRKKFINLMGSADGFYEFEVYQRKKLTNLLYNMKKYLKPKT